MSYACTAAPGTNNIVNMARELRLSTAALNKAYLKVVNKEASEPVEMCHDCPACSAFYNEKLNEYGIKLNRTVR